MKKRSVEERNLKLKGKNVNVGSPHKRKLFSCMLTAQSTKTMSPFPAEWVGLPSLC